MRSTAACSSSPIMLRLHLCLCLFWIVDLWSHKPNPSICSWRGPFFNFSTPLAAAELAVRSLFSFFVAGGARRFFLYRIPHALQRDLGPEGPARQRGVVVVRQYAQLLSSQPLLLGSTDPGLISGLESSIAFNLVLVELKQSARWLRSDVCCS